MKNKELIERLMRFNLDAEVEVSILGTNVQPFPFYSPTDIKDVCSWGNQNERKMMDLTAEDDRIKVDENRVCICIEHGII